MKLANLTTDELFKLKDEILLFHNEGFTDKQSILLKACTDLFNKEIGLSKQIYELAFLVLEEIATRYRIKINNK